MLNLFKRIAAPVVVWITIMAAAVAAAEHTARPFAPGEKLTFDLSWGGINAGVFGKGSFSVGMKYASQLCLLGWAVFELAGVKMGLQAGGG